MVGLSSPETSVNEKLTMHSTENDAQASTGIHMPAVHAVDDTPQPDAKAVTPSNKALNTLGKTPIDVYTLSSYLKDHMT